MFIYLKQNVGNIGCKCAISKVDLKNGFYYQVLFSGKASAFSIIRALNYCSSKPLPIVANDVKVPKSLKFRLLDDEKYNTVLLLNAFSYCSKKTALIVDSDGVLADKIHIALSRINEVFILTEREDLYDAKNDEYLHTVGTAPILISKTSKRRDFGTVLSPFADVSGCLDGVIFGKGGYSVAGNTVIYKNREYDRMLSAALYTLANDKKSSLCLPPALCKNGEIIPLEYIKNTLDKCSKLCL